jgi:hypothetical protein
MERQQQIPIGAPTAAKPANEYAGSKLSRVMQVGGMGLTVLGAGFDAASLLSGNKKGKEEARAMAQRLVDAGYTDYDQIMSLAQNDAQLESAIGDIGASDYAKTAAGVGLQATDILTGGPLALITAPLGALAQVDLQRKKAGRNEAFREQFAQELINRGLA